MKHLLCILLIFSFFINLPPSSAQDTLPVTQSPMLMSLGTHNGFTVIIPQARLKVVTNAWKKYIKRGETKASVEENDEEFQIKGTMLESISQHPINAYAQIRDMEKSIRLTAYFTEDDTNYISSLSSPEKAVAAEKLMKDFARIQYRLAVEYEVETETKKLSEMENQKEDLIKANEKSEKTIGENERLIEHAKVEIEANSAAQTRRRSDVDGQKEVVRITTKKTETYDIEEKKLHSLEKELRKLENDGESMHNDIDGWKSDNSQQQRNIEKNDELIKEKKEAIKLQKDHVKDVQEKLERIQ
jgi:hypothetical protein